MIENFAHGLTEDKEICFNKIDHKGYAPLHYAAQHDKADAVIFMLDAQAGHFQPNYFFRQILYYAVMIII